MKNENNKDSEFNSQNTDIKNTKHASKASHGNEKSSRESDEMNMKLDEDADYTIEER